MRLIDADALIQLLRTCADDDWNKNTPAGTWSSAYEEMILHVEDAPTIEPKKGKWIRHDEIKNVYGGIYIECSECGEKYVVQYMEDEKFCRNCGADMRSNK